MGARSVIESIIERWIQLRRVLVMVESSVLLFFFVLCRVMYNVFGGLLVLDGECI